MSVSEKDEEAIKKAQHSQLVLNKLKKIFIKRANLGLRDMEHCLELEFEDGFKGNVLLDTLLVEKDEIKQFVNKKVSLFFQTKREVIEFKSENLRTMVDVDFAEEIRNARNSSRQS